MYVNKTGIKLFPNPKRVLLLPFNLWSVQRINKTIKRIMDLSEDAVLSLLDEIKNKFEHRHQQFENRFNG